MTARYTFPDDGSFWEDDQTLTNRQRAMRLLDRAEAILNNLSETTSLGGQDRANRIAEADSRIRIAQVLLGVRYPL